MSMSGDDNESKRAIERVRVIERVRDTESEE